MGWSLAPGKIWGPNGTIIDDPDYPTPQPASSPSPPPQGVGAPPMLDFGDGGDTSYTAASGRANLSGLQPGQSYQQQPAYSASFDQGANMGEEDYGGGGYYGDIPDTGGGVLDMGGNTFIGSGPEASGGYSPGGTNSYGDTQYSPTQYRDQSFGNTNFDLFSGGSQYSPSRSGGGGGGGQQFRPTGLAAQQPQMMQLGQPERTAYDRYQAQTAGGPDQTLYNKYSQLLQNPSTFAQDPAYQFLFNQGMQGLNRSMAAKKMASSGTAGLDALNYGQGAANQYAAQRIGQLGQGAGQEFQRYAGQNQALGGASSQELQRFMGPAGLLPSYVGGNNQAINQAGANQASQALIPMYQQMLSQQGGGGYGGYLPPGTSPNTGASYNGITPGNQGYNQMLNPQMIQQLLAQGGGQQGSQYGTEGDWNNMQDTLYGA